MNITEEYGQAWTNAGELFKLADDLGIPFDLTKRFGLLGAARVSIEGSHYQPTKHGEWSVIIAVRGNPDGDIEADDPYALVTGGPVLDLLAIPLDGLDQWALRRGSVTFVGAIEPQFVSPDPVRVHRTPLGWLRSGCDGIAFLTDDPLEQQDILLRIRRPAGEDLEHGEELERIITRRRFAPEIFVQRATT